ncbi:MAG: tetratricopeptide repeat protein [Sedimentisphaerales bacterium]
MTGSGKFEQAEKEYEKILLIQPQNIIAHSDFGVVLFQQGKFDDAIAHFNEAIRIDPHYTAAKNNLKLVLTEKQKTQSESKENTKKK